jgi:hypothetical protein
VGAVYNGNGRFCWVEIDATRHNASWRYAPKSSGKHWLVAAVRLSKVCTAIA